MWKLHPLHVLPVLLLEHKEAASEQSINFKFVILIVDYYYRHVLLPQLLDPQLAGGVSVWPVCLMQDQTTPSPPY